MSEDERPDDVQRLAAFLGDWDVKGSLTAGDETGAVSGFWSFKPTIDGWGIEVASETSIEGMGVFSEAELIGLDPAEGKVHMFSLNRFAARDHIGSWVGDNALTVRYNGTIAGVDVIEEINIEFADPVSMAAHIEEFNDGVLSMTTDLKMDRRTRHRG